MSAQADRRAYEAWHVAGVVERRLKSNGDWNINDWKDVAGVLARYVLAHDAPTPNAQRSPSVGRVENPSAPKELPDPAVGGTT